MAEYKNIKDFDKSPDCYRVGDDGTVWSWRCKAGTKKWRWKQLKPWTVKGGYQIIGLKKDGKRTCRYVHNLVLENFISDRPEGMEGCHNNDDPIDNKLENLRWDTPKNNCADRTKRGVHLKNTGRGSTHGCHKLFENQVLEIRSSNKHLKDLAATYNVSPRTIRDILTRKRWKHI
jgi:hypothetical protein